MFLTKQHLTKTRMLGLAAVAALSLGACATYDDDFAAINSRLDQLDARVSSAASSAQSADANAQRANQRLDEMEGRIQSLESQPGRRPRG